MIKKAYVNFRKNLSDKNKGRLSKMAFSLSDRPKVLSDNIPADKKFPGGEKGGLIISADFELAWAFRFSKTGADPIAKAMQARENFPGIIKVFDDNNIPITFATVGHLFLEKCEKGDHDWMRRIPHFDDHWRFLEGDWFDADPYTDHKKDPAWYAPDLIKMIQDAKAEHEISTHTFTHMDCTYKNCPPEVMDDELKACIEVAKPYGVTIKSLVFPGGTWGNIESLKKHGIDIYRKNVEHDLAYPWRDKQGLLVTNSSGALEFNRGFEWSADYFVNRLKKNIDKAIETNTIAHLWFHPSMDPFFLKEVFPPFFEYAAKKRDSGKLWVGTMKAIADHINKNNLL